MKMTGTAMLALLIWAISSFAEGIWQANGFVFSNVHAWQKGGQVTVSGRVSGGTLKNPLQAHIVVQNDEGRTYRALATVRNYTGKGETFQATFVARKKAQWWKIVTIDTN